MTASLWIVGILVAAWLAYPVLRVIWWYVLLAVAKLTPKPTAERAAWVFVRFHYRKMSDLDIPPQLRAKYHYRYGGTLVRATSTDPLDLMPVITERYPRRINLKILEVHA